MLDLRRKVIPLEPAPIELRPKNQMVLNLAYPLAKVLYECGVISWEEYAEIVPPEFRPLRYRYPPDYHRLRRKHRARNR